MKRGVLHIAFLECPAQSTARLLPSHSTVTKNNLFWTVSARLSEHSYTVKAIFPNQNFLQFVPCEQ